MYAGVELRVAHIFCRSLIKYLGGARQKPIFNFLKNWYLL